MFQEPYQHKKTFDMADIDNFYNDKLDFTDVEEQLQDQFQEFKETVEDTKDSDRQKGNEEKPKEKPKSCGCRH